MSIIRKIVKQLVMVFTVMLILFATYLSIGRQFMPAVARYKPGVEERIAEVVGVPVSIDSLTGYFEGFNPAISIEGLRLQVLNDGDVSAQPGQALEFEQATLVLDMAQTIWQRQIVLGDFIVEGLEINARQQENGQWQLSGVTPTATATGTFDLENVYQTVQRVSRLQINNLNLELNSLAGNVTRLRDSTAVIQNAAGNHYIHIDTSVDGTDDPILLSVELTGETLEEVSGLVHAALPNADYSASLGNESIGAVTLGQVVGGGHIWFSVEQGQIQQIALSPDIDTLSFSISENNLLSFSDIAGNATLQRHIPQSAWEFTAENLQFDWSDTTWPESDTYVYYNDEGMVRIKSDSLDVGILTDIINTSGIGGEGLTEQLEGFRPRGSLRNLSLSVPLDTDSGSGLQLSANTDNIAVDSFRNSPVMTGINGYLEISHDFERMVTAGFADVESENFTIQIPTIFLDTWDYDYVNGRVYFQVDLLEGRSIKLSSSMITAESEIVDGRAQFSSHTVTVDDVRTVQDFSLLVGGVRIDGSMKSPYLPTGPRIQPGLRNTMEWLDQALLDGAVYSSGVLFHGSLLPESPSEARTFQGFFEFDQGRLRYDEAWPELSDLSGTVVVDNRNVDIVVDQGQSLGLDIFDTTGMVRQEDNGDQWLTVSGRGTGATQSGLDFLAVAPLSATLAETIDNWQAEGEVAAEISLRIPFGIPDAEVEVDVAANLESNNLFFPEYDLQFEDINGLISYDTENGLHAEELEGRLFDGPVTVTASSKQIDSQDFRTDIQVFGKVDSIVLADWSGQTEFVSDLLGFTEGEFDYRAQLIIEQGQDQSTSNSLAINSNLEGLALQLPQPFGKPADQPMPISLTLDFDDNGSNLQATLGSELNTRLALQEGIPATGIVYLGTMPGMAEPWQPRNSQPGLDLRGNLDIFAISEWLDTMSGAGSVASPSRDLTQWVSQITLDIGTLDIFGQEFESVNVDIPSLEDEDYWTIGLISDAVSGSVLVPLNSDEYIRAFLAYLHLPGAESEESDLLDPELSEAVAQEDEEVSDEEEEEEVERVDVLAQVDPRDLPKFTFATGNFSIGDRDYGQGWFTLDPTPTGVEISNVIVNFRGLEADTTGEDDDPFFVWEYDGIDHHSYLSSLVIADDMAVVLEENGFEPSLESNNAYFEANLDWPGSPAFFSSANLSGDLTIDIDDGRFLQGSNGQGALRLVSIINLAAIMRRARFSDDLLRSGLAFEEIEGALTLEDGIVTINDRLVITGPSSVYQIAGTIDLENETIDGEMYLTLPVSDNIPWIGLVTGNIPLAIGAYLFDRIFGDQVDNLTSAQYTLSGPWEGLEPEFRQAFGTGDDDASSSTPTPQ